MHEYLIKHFRMLYKRCPIITIVVWLILLPKVATGPITDRSIPVEHSCNRLPYILKDTELRFSYSADHLMERNCVVTISAQDKVCVSFVEYYLDCETDIIFAENVKSVEKKTYRCDTKHSADFCSSKSTLQIIFQRKKNLHKDGFGYAELRVYGTSKPGVISGTALTVIIVIGGIFGILLLLILSSVLLSRALYNLHYKARLEQTHNLEGYPLQGEVPVEPPPPYQGPEHEQGDTAVPE
ncbi:uncharacterized protein LOC132715908 isoform X2 [Ruditapes philippinarum]|uniref:uncharacterized protein LOC132715908 isoform X2 n=1 Tax=Ruditapes philippinarum TaxID=129788 RepID=UPI00295B9FCA|nr:uncharacterized protein LOC132715908 isoform X2 [Ruditapes philippinarum]